MHIQFINTWTRFEKLALLFTFVAFYQILAYNVEVVPGWHIDESWAETLKDLSIGYIGGYVLYYLTAFLRWNREMRTKDLELRNKCHTYRHKFYDNLNRLAGFNCYKPQYSFDYTRKASILRKMIKNTSNFNHTDDDQIRFSKYLGELEIDSSDTLKKIDNLMDSVKDIVDFANNTLHNYNVYMNFDKRIIMNLLSDSNVVKELQSVKRTRRNNSQIWHNLYNFKLLVDELIYHY